MLWDGQEHLFPAGGIFKNTDVTAEIIGPASLRAFLHRDEIKPGWQYGGH
jgi:hypothetical protein